MDAMFLEKRLLDVQQLQHDDLTENFWLMLVNDGLLLGGIHQNRKWNEYFDA